MIPIKRLMDTDEGDLVKMNMTDTNELKIYIILKMKALTVDTRDT